jgi:hypothetical protein
MVRVLGDATPVPFAVYAHGYGLHLLASLPERVDLQIPLALIDVESPYADEKTAARARYLGDGPGRQSAVLLAGVWDERAALLANRSIRTILIPPVTTVGAVPPLSRNVSILPPSPAADRAEVAGGVAPPQSRLLSLAARTDIDAELVLASLTAYLQAMNECLDDTPPPLRHVLLGEPRLLSALERELRAPSQSGPSVADRYISLLRGVAPTSTGVSSGRSEGFQA